MSGWEQAGTEARDDGSAHAQLWECATVGLCGRTVSDNRSWHKLNQVWLTYVIGNCCKLLPGFGGFGIWHVPLLLYSTHGHAIYLYPRPSIYTPDTDTDPDILICDGSWNSTPARKQASKSSQANTSHLNSLEVGKARHKAISFSQSQIAWKNNLRKMQLWAPHSLCWLPTMSKWRLGFQHWAGNEQTAWGRCLCLDTLPVWCGKLLLKGQETTQGTEVYVNCPRLMGNWAVSIHHLQRVSNGSYLQSTRFVSGQKG